MPTLFDTYTLKDITLRNRIVVGPMCQYTAQEACRMIGTACITPHWPVAVQRLLWWKPQPFPPKGALPLAALVYGMMSRLLPLPPLQRL